MAENKKGFILYCDLIHTIEQLPDDKAGELFKHILRYVNDLNPITDDLVTKITFEPIKQQLKRDLNKWAEKSLKRSEAGRLGGLKSGISRKQNEANEAIASNLKQNEQVIVTDNVIDKEKESINKRDAAKAATLKRVETFKLSLYPFTDKQGGVYEAEMVKDFFEYWSELNKSETKMKWELQPTFEISKRLSKWAANDNKFNKNNNGKNKQSNDRQSEEQHLALVELGIRNAEQIIRDNNLSR